MTAAAKLAERNITIAELKATESALDSLFAQPFSNRVYAQCQELLDNREFLAGQVVMLGGDPGPNPVDRYMSETRAM